VGNSKNNARSTNEDSCYNSQGTGLRSHSESINIETEKALTPEQVRRFGQCAGVVLQDDPAANLYPMPLYASNKDEVFVADQTRHIN
jgi:aspartate-semialdehyde dehydrogenase